MSIKGGNFWKQNRAGLAVAPQSLSNSVGTGAAVVEPWIHGRECTFLVTAGAWGTGGSLTIAFQGQQRSDDAWAALMNGAATPAALELVEADGGNLETDGYILATLDLSRVESSTYKAVRMVITETATQAVLVGASYVVSNLTATPSGEANDTWMLQRYGAV